MCEEIGNHRMKLPEPVHESPKPIKKDQVMQYVRFLSFHRYFALNILASNSYIDLVVVTV